MDLSTAKGVHDAGEGVQILDVREDFEWKQGRVPGSVHVPLNRLLAGEDGGLDPTKPVVAICRSGSRSEVARVLLRARGFDAHNLRGGTEEWARDGLPFVAEDGSPGRVA